MVLLKNDDDISTSSDIHCYWDLYIDISLEGRLSYTFSIWLHIYSNPYITKISSSSFSFLSLMFISTYVIPPHCHQQHHPHKTCTWCRYTHTIPSYIYNTTSSSSSSSSSGAHLDRQSRGGGTGRWSGCRHPLPFILFHGYISIETGATQDEGYTCSSSKDSSSSSSSRSMLDHTCFYPPPVIWQGYQWIHDHHHHHVGSTFLT